MTYSDNASHLTSSKSRNGFRFIAVLLFALLIVAVVWLFFEIGRIGIAP